MWELRRRDTPEAYPLDDPPRTSRPKAGLSPVRIVTMRVSYLFKKGADPDFWISLSAKAGIGNWPKNSFAVVLHFSPSLLPTVNNLQKVANRLKFHFFL